MDLQTQRLAIIEKVLHLESSDLTAVIHLLNSLDVPGTGDEDLPLMPSRGKSEMKVRLEQSLKELDDKEGIPHEQVVAMMTQRFKVS